MYSAAATDIRASRSELAHRFLLHPLGHARGVDLLCRVPRFPWSDRRPRPAPSESPSSARAGNTHAGSCRPPTAPATESSIRSSRTSSSLIKDSVERVHSGPHVERFEHFGLTGVAMVVRLEAMKSDSRPGCDVLCVSVCRSSNTLNEADVDNKAPPPSARRVASQLRLPLSRVAADDHRTGRRRLGEPLRRRAGRRQAVRHRDGSAVEHVGPVRVRRGQLPVRRLPDVLIPRQH